MKAVMCDRCGKNCGPFREAGIQLVFDGIETHNADLCENCYQTIKEVLEDGEIK